MASHKPNPAALAAGRAVDGFICLAAMNHHQIAQSLGISSLFRSLSLICEARA
jgi:hypothetical protein